MPKLFMQASETGSLVYFAVIHISCLEQGPRKIMKIKGCGQAKVLRLEERSLFWEKGFLCQRDRTLNQICYYTACRISESRQLFYKDVFNPDGSVKDNIVFRREITKGKLRARCMTTHPNLKESLNQYVRDSEELLKIKILIGEWDHQSLDRNNIISFDGQLQCPKCSNTQLTKAGRSRGKQILKCLNKECSYRFQEKTAFLERPELKDAVIRLGVANSYCYGFLFIDPNNPFLFPGFGGKGCLSRTAAKEIFTDASKRSGIIGASTHSWRRTALTEMSEAKTPLRVIQKISGHQRLANLQRYLEVTQKQVNDAIDKLPYFSPEPKVKLTPDVE